MKFERTGARPNAQAAINRQNRGNTRILTGNYQVETVTIGVAITTVQTARLLSVYNPRTRRPPPPPHTSRSAPPLPIDAHRARWLNNRFQTFGSFMSTFLASSTAS